MKVISKIYPKDGSWEGLCVDGSVVPLVTWLKSVQEVKVARDCDWSASNIFKVQLGNRTYPLWHPKGGYIDSLYTTVLFS